MSTSLSPYALLCASKPKQVPTVTTSYDLFSASQMTPSSVPSTPECAGAADIPNTQNSNPICNTFSSSYIYQSAQRTHYIADIHARHNAAGLRSSGRRI